MAVAPDGSVAYEVELRPFKVWKLTNGEGGGVAANVKKQEQSYLGAIMSGIWGMMG